MRQEVRKGILTVRASKVREETVRLLTRETMLRPNEIFKKIRDRVDTVEANLYKSLEKLEEEGIVTKMKEGKRISLYSLTDLGREVADFLGLSESEEVSDEEKLRMVAFNSDLEREQVVNILDKIKRELENKDAE